MNENIGKRQDLLLAMAAFVIAFVLWQFRLAAPIIYPLRLFVTFIHELGHGTATLVTGGEFVGFEVKSTGAGLAISRGGVRWIVVSAGHVGTAIFGAMLLYLANSGKSYKRPRHVAMLLGMSFVMLTMLYTGLGLGNFNVLEIGIVLIILGGSGYAFLKWESEKRWIAGTIAAIGLILLIYFAAGNNTLTLVVGVFSGVGLILLGYYARRDITLFMLNFLAFTVGFNAITDAFVLLRIVSAPRFVPHNDASSMADVTPLPAAFWAFSWIILSIILLGTAIWLTFVRPIRQGKYHE